MTLLDNVRELLELRKAQEQMRQLPEEARAILRKGYYVANLDGDYWVITNLKTGKLIDRVKKAEYEAPDKSTSN